MQHLRSGRISRILNVAFDILVCKIVVTPTADGVSYQGNFGQFDNRHSGIEVRRHIPYHGVELNDALRTEFYPIRLSYQIQINVHITRNRDGQRNDVTGGDVIQPPAHDIFRGGVFRQQFVHDFVGNVECRII